MPERLWREQVYNLWLIAETVPMPVYVTLIIGGLVPVIIALIGVKRGTEARHQSTGTQTELETTRKELSVAQEQLGRLEERLVHARERQDQLEVKFEEVLIREKECRDLITAIIEKRLWEA